MARRRKSKNKPGLILVLLGAVRTVPLEQKRKVFLFVRDSNQLRNAIEVKDFTRTEQIADRMRLVAKDFDDPKPRAAIETSRTVSNLRFTDAKLAASQGDAERVRENHQAAAEIWPRNLRLKEVSEMITGQGHIRGQALFDSDRLIAQKNHRQSSNDQGRYAGAVLDDSARQEQLSSRPLRTAKASAARVSSVSTKPTRRLTSTTFNHA